MRTVRFANIVTILGFLAILKPLHTHPHALMETLTKTYQNNIKNITWVL